MRAVYVSFVIIGISLFWGYIQAKKCNCVCTQDYAPVCAADSKGQEQTFASRCNFDCYICTHSKDYLILNYGECSDKNNSKLKPNYTTPRKTQDPKCNCDCHETYSPLCALYSEGGKKTFRNRCALDCYDCTHNKGHLIRKDGECSAASTSPPTTRIDNQNNQRKPVVKKCNCDCARNYTPLCAADSNGTEQTFPNRCSLDCYKCSFDKEYVIRRGGECLTSNAQVNTPKSTSSNQGNLPTAKCNCECPFNYSPVCAVDSSGIKETFPTRCALDCYKCTHTKVYAIEKPGECSNNIIPNTSSSTHNNQRKAPSAKCKCQCSLNHSPICAVDSNGTQETFPNRCALDCYKCTHDKSYVVEKPGECSANGNTIPNSLSPTRNNQRTPSAAKCNCRCTLNYSPICAADTAGIQQTFPNRCALDCYKCTHNKEYVVRNEGECSETSSASSKVRIPNRNASGKPAGAKCNCQCSLDYSPICALGSEGQMTFPNRCALDCYKCTHNKEYVLQKLGECSSNGAVTPNSGTSKRNN